MTDQVSPQRQGRTVPLLGPEHVYLLAAITSRKDEHFSFLPLLTAPKPALAALLHSRRNGSSGGRQKAQVPPVVQFAVCTLPSNSHPPILNFSPHVSPRLSEPQICLFPLTTELSAHLSLRTASSSYEPKAAAAATGHDRLIRVPMTLWYISAGERSVRRADGGQWLAAGIITSDHSYAGRQERWV